MIVKSKCQFCSKELHLEIDDDYAKLGDPFKLTRLASCNRCSDLKTRQRKLERRMEYFTGLLRVKMTDKESENLRLSMGKTSQDYLRCICEFLRVDYVDWDESILDALMTVPLPPKVSNLGDVVRRMWAMAKHPKQRELAVSTPYKD